jgi:hypothetical protein
MLELILIAAWVVGASVYLYFRLRVGPGPISAYEVRGGGCPLVPSALYVRTGKFGTPKRFLTGFYEDLDSMERHLDFDPLVGLTIPQAAEYARSKWDNVKVVV